MPPATPFDLLPTHLIDNDFYQWHRRCSLEFANRIFSRSWSTIQEPGANMRNVLSKVAGACILAAGLAAGSANAAFIIGGISVTDGIDLTSLPAPPSTSIVSALTGITHDPAELGATFGCVGTFAAQASCVPDATMTNWAFAGPFPDIIVVDGFTFDLQFAGAVVPIAMTCQQGTCADGLSIFISGIVSGNGFDPSAFTGQLSMTGGCNESAGGGGTCGSNYTAGYTYSLTATGEPQQVPEPGTLALMGLAIAGMALARRRRQ
jgi:hypothetical protein